MEALKEELEETEIGRSVESFRKFLDSQRELFHNQIDQLQRIVVTQCKLTGVNPLSQEMAAGALSVKIGKRPRDLLNPKAVKYMQAVFSIKDAISKKESREISAQFGITVTQVRDFFTSQRSRVRRLARLSREKAIRANAWKGPQDAASTSSDPMIPNDPVPLNSVGPDLVPLNPASPNPVPFNSVGPSSLPLTSVCPSPVPLTSVGATSAPLSSVGPDPVPLTSLGHDPVPSTSVGTSSVEERPSCLPQDDTLPGLDDLDKHFVENIFSLLRKEETFSGQVKLMEWIMQIQNSSVINWFLTKGGVMILATWLSQAAAEEQTSVLLVILKVLCHLPLHKAQPEHMSAILHSVNRLRFYRTSDISNRARVLLSRWSRMFARSQSMKKPNGIRSSTDAQEMILKQSIDEIMGDELWQSNVGNPEDVLALSSESSENIRNLQTVKMLPASADDQSRRNILGVSSTHNRERRKVQLVEQPGQKTAGRSPQATKSVPVSQGRPMSADDIQKAKLRALYMQSKYGKPGSSSNGSNGVKTEGPKKPSNILSSNLSSLSKVPVRPKIDDHKKAVIPSPKITSKHESLLDPKQKMVSKEPLGELCNRVKIPWQTPPEIKLSDLWRVGAGENSKEVDVQKNRNRRDMETIYQTLQEVPSNPKEPWDLEMDYDDTLTPEIPIEQPPDADSAETQVLHSEHVNKVVVSAPSVPQIAGGSASEPDLELLAVLLKNPELVFALTSGQAGNLSSEETVKLLDMIKRGGVGLASGLNGFGGKVVEKVEVSLPSPTPSSNPGTSGWTQDVAKNPFSQHSSMGNRIAYSGSGVNATVPSAEKLTSLVQPQNQATNIRIPQQLESVPLLSQQVSATIPSFSLPRATTMIPEKRQPPMVPSSHQNFPTNSSMFQTPSSEIALTMKSTSITAPSLPNFSMTTGLPMRVETVSNLKPAPSMSFPVDAPERGPVSFPLPTLLPTPTLLQPQPPVVTEHPIVYASRMHTGNVGTVPDSLRARQGLPLNSLSQANLNNYDTSFGGPVQPQLRAGPPRGRNEYMSDDGFESWSPENSPVRSPDYHMPGRNYSRARINSGWEHMPDNRSRHRNSSGYRGHNRNGNRRWR